MMSSTPSAQLLVNICVVTTFHVICSASRMIFHLSLAYSCIDISGITRQHTCEADVRDLRCAGVKKWWAPHRLQSASGVYLHVRAIQSKCHCILCEVLLLQHRVSTCEGNCKSDLLYYFVRLLTHEHHFISCGSSHGSHTQSMSTFSALVSSSKHRFCVYSVLFSSTSHCCMLHN